MVQPASKSVDADWVYVGSIVRVNVGSIVRVNVDPKTLLTCHANEGG